MEVSKKRYNFAQLTFNNTFKMAKPIKETPVLIGKDAVRLVAKIDNPRKVSDEEVATARKAYESVLSIAKFNF